MPASPPAPALPVLAEVVRSGFVEGWHHGSVVAVGPDGGVLLSAGDPAAPVFPRSSNKPMQAAAMVRAGLDLPGPLLALVAASHNGEPVHVAGVREILSRAGLTPADLQNTPDLSLDEPSARAHLRAGGEPDSLHQNCSGKHAGMLATCVVAGWPTQTYLQPDHPLQRLIRATLEELAGEPAAATGVDGCGAPLFAVSLVGLARAFQALVRAEPGSAEARVAAAMRAHPYQVAGRNRDDTELMSGLAGCLAKGGAEGVHAAALDDGTAVALKIADGASRARTPVLVAALRAAGAAAPVLAQLATTPVLGHGVPVGEVRAVPLAP